MVSRSGNPARRFDARCDHGDPPTVHLSGEIDIASRERLTALIDKVARPGHDLVIECTRIEFIDASGIRVLVHAAEVIGGGQLRLRGVHGSVAAIIQILDLTATVANLHLDPT